MIMRALFCIKSSLENYHHPLLSLSCKSILILFFPIISLISPISKCYVPFNALDGEHHEPQHQQRQQPRQPTATTHAGASVDHAGIDAADYATNHGDYAKRPRKSCSAAVATLRQVG
jgi:hypothetical protein